MLKSQVQVAPFREHPVIDHQLAEPDEFDIIAFGADHSPNFIISGKFSLQQYCTCLLHRLFLLDKSQIKPFIQYQCEQLAEPFIWLNKFEKLIDINMEIFITKAQKSSVNKALMVVEVVRQEIQSNKFNAQAKYDFAKLKQKIKKYGLRPIFPRSGECRVGGNTVAIQAGFFFSQVTILALIKSNISDSTFKFYYSFLLCHFL